MRRIRGLMRSRFLATAVFMTLPMFGCENKQDVQKVGTLEPRAPCFYAGQEYSDGAWMCQENKLMTCNDGRWLVRGDACAKPCEKECPSPE